MPRIPAGRVVFVDPRAGTIVARVRWPMHTGQLEGINNRIKVMKRMAYGYRDSAFFFLKIKAAYPGNP
jgi:transposase